MKKAIIDVEVRYTQIIEREISDECFDEIGDALGRTLTSVKTGGDLFDLLVGWCNEIQCSDWEVEIESLCERREEKE